MNEQREQRDIRKKIRDIMAEMALSEDCGNAAEALGFARQIERLAADLRARAEQETRTRSPHTCTRQEWIDTHARDYWDALPEDERRALAGRLWDENHRLMGELEK